MNKEIEIKSIKLKIGEKEIELAVKDAKKLKGALDDLFKKEVVKEVYYPFRYPHWYWNYGDPAPYLIGDTVCSVTADANTMVLDIGDVTNAT